MPIAAAAPSASVRLVAATTAASMTTALSAAAFMPSAAIFGRAWRLPSSSRDVPDGREGVWRAPPTSPRTSDSIPDFFAGGSGGTSGSGGASTPNSLATSPQFVFDLGRAAGRGSLALCCGDVGGATTGGGGSAVGSTPS